MLGYRRISSNRLSIGGSTSGSFRSNLELQDFVAGAVFGEPQRGSPLAMTSILRSSCRWMLSMFKSMSRVLVVTRALEGDFTCSAHWK